MRTYASVGLAAVALHIAATLLLPLYRHLLTGIGGWFVHATDIADIPELVLAGFLTLGGLLLLAALGVTYAMRRRAGA